MATELKVLQVSLEDRPGALADVAGAIAAAGINVEAVLAYSVGGQTEAHLAFVDGEAARSALEGAGHRVAGERNAFVVQMEDRVGALAELTQRLAGAGVNLSLTHLATNNRLLLSADDEGTLRSLV
ncbi:MAG: ACT domain-containing protein [Candidatus Dormibacter sp.]|uniref:ACT domain-containing protein n=1 Tax=Candidatus Dormibacter sp. TaxID=2973982 RepID=UPI000DB2F14A|nr:MAG: amino acid-binding protein [Candidatus Dormibacteraeota bacterium]